jgi:hypothetical protein
MLLKVFNFLWKQQLVFNRFVKLPLNSINRIQIYELKLLNGCIGNGVGLEKPEWMVLEIMLIRIEIEIFSLN